MHVANVSNQIFRYDSERCKLLVQGINKMPTVENESKKRVYGTEPFPNHQKLTNSNSKKTSDPPRKGKEYGRDWLEEVEVHSESKWTKLLMMR